MLRLLGLPAGITARDGCRCVAERVMNGGEAAFKMGRTKFFSKVGLGGRYDYDYAMTVVT